MGYIGKVTAGGSTHLVGSTLYGTCSTAADTAIKVVTCEDFTTLETGVTIHVKFTYPNSVSIKDETPRLNVNSTGSKVIRVSNRDVDFDTWQAGAVVSFTYDGTYWIMNDYSENTDTLDTAGSTNSASKLYLVGATSQAANPQTYSNSNVYATNGALTASTYNGLTLTKASTGFTIAGGTTSKTLTVGDSYTLGAACEKSVGSVASGNTGLVTGGAVFDYVTGVVSGSAQFMGTIGKGLDSTYTQADLQAANYKSGWYFVCNTPGTFVGETCEVGDMIWCVDDKGDSYSASDFSVVQQNIDTISTSEIDTIVAA